MSACEVQGALRAVLAEQELERGNAQRLKDQADELF